MNEANIKLVIDRFESIFMEDVNAISPKDIHGAFRLQKMHKQASELRTIVHDTFRRAKIKVMTQLWNGEI